MIDLKTIAAEATIAGALGLTALGMGAGRGERRPTFPRHLRDAVATR